MKTSRLLPIVLVSLFSSASAIADVILVDSAQLESMIADDAVVIDVRREDEWKNTGIIENSHTATFFDQYGGFDSDQWLAEVSPLIESGRSVVLICHGGVRSNWIAKWLDTNTNLETIYDATEGIAGWVNQGKSTHKY